MLIVDDPEQGLHGLQLVVRRLALDQLDDGAAYAPNVGRGCGARQLNDLGGHPVRRAHDARLVQARLLGSHAKVGQLDKALFCGQDVGALDVSVYYALLVEVEQAVEDLGHVEGDEVFWEFAKVLADGVQRPVFAVLEDDVQAL